MEENIQQWKTNYQSQPPEKLRKENVKLKRQLDKLSLKITFYFDRTLVKGNQPKKQKENAQQVVLAQLKNSEVQKKNLQVQKNTLEKGLQMSIKRKGKNIEKEIDEEKARLKHLQKQIRENSFDINKNSKILTQNTKSFEEVYTQYEKQLANLLTQNERKQRLIETNNKKEQEMRQKIEELKQNLTYTKEEDKIEDDGEKELQKKWKHLASKKGIMESYTKSLIQRWTQQYCWKLRQLNELNEGIQSKDQKQRQLKVKIEEQKELLEKKKKQVNDN